MAPLRWWRRDKTRNWGECSAIKYVVISPIRWGWGCWWCFFPFLLFGGGDTNYFWIYRTQINQWSVFVQRRLGVCSICLDSVSKQISASKYGWEGLVRFSGGYSGVVEGGGRVFNCSSTVITSGSTAGDSG